MVNSHYQKINASYNQIERRKWPLTYALINHEGKEPRHNFRIENSFISHHIKATFHKKGQTSCLNYIYFATQGLKMSQLRRVFYPITKFIICIYNKRMDLSTTYTLRRGFLNYHRRPAITT